MLRYGKTLLLGLATVLALQLTPAPEAEARVAASATAATAATAGATAARAATARSATSTTAGRYAATAHWNTIAIVAALNVSAVQDYEDDHGAYPEDIQQLHDEGYIRSASHTEDWSIEDGVLINESLPDEALADYPAEYVDGGEVAIPVAEVDADALADSADRSTENGMVALIVLTGLALVFLAALVFR